MSFRLCKLVIPIALFAVACGGGDDDKATPDAGGDNADATVGVVGCEKFDTPAGTINTYPGTFSGNLVGAGADHNVAEMICTDERSYFAQDGEDQVIRLDGLAPGQRYGIVIDGAGSDLGAYVVNGCSGSDVAAGECLVFADEQVAESEIVDFLGPNSGPLFLVVDHFGEGPLDAGAYTVDIIEAECGNDTECSGATPFCSEFVCVECLTSFDCQTASLGVCDAATNTCIAGHDECTGDDPSPPESGDDGPLGAVTITDPTEGNPTIINQNICSAPLDEADFFQIAIAADTSRIFTLDWAGETENPDLDLTLLDENGVAIANSFFDKPELIIAENLAAGNYFIVVSKFESTGVPVPAAVGYTLTVSIPECTTSFDCLDANVPVCGPSRTCVAGPAECTGDDVNEDDDGPAAATTLTSGTPVNAAICNTPANEIDYYKITVANGDSLNVTASFDGANMADIDIRVLDSEQTVLGFTFWQNPETIDLTFLPAGTYFIEVTYFAQTPIVAAHAYSITATATATAGCAAATDCDDVFRTQTFRGLCNVGTGACSAIEGNELLVLGAACDSPDDCTSGICSNLLFQQNAAESVCTVGCTTTADCTTAHGAGFSCTVPFQNNTCHPDCSVALDCGVNPGSETLDAGEPWDYLTCSAGACDLDP